MGCMHGFARDTWKGLTQLDKQGVHPSELAYTTRQTSTHHLLEQDNQTAQEPTVQGTTIWHLLMSKLQQSLTITTIRTYSKTEDFFTLTNSFSMVDPQIPLYAVIATIQAISNLILLLPSSRWEISSPSLDQRERLERTVGG